MPRPPVAGELEKNTAPLLQLGPTLGEGAHGVVVEAEPAEGAPAAVGSLLEGGTEGTGAVAGSASRLAVKILRAQKLRGAQHVAAAM